MDKKKILIVDDDQDLVKALRVRLGAHNYETVFAIDAVSAISQAKSENPDLIILDLGLPDGNGFIVMDRLQQIDSLASIPVIVITGQSPRVYKDAALIAGAAGYLQKPIENEDLLSAIRRALDDPPGSKKERLSNG
jgi:two-component system KDP operon response regulator KdpE